MEKKVYTLTGLNDGCRHYAGTKKDALRLAREYAASEKQSYEIMWRNEHYVGIAEFPVYLRDLSLTWKDIYLNLF